MICFRNLYLWYSDTTRSLTIKTTCLLWFAFEIYIFDILIQQRALKQLKKLGCDLLSKFISLIFWYNISCRVDADFAVVICFRNLYLWYSDTTHRLYPIQQSALWFAFEIYIFDILIQLLLLMLQVVQVVICFRNLYLWYSDTTKRNGITGCTVLWFAFEIYIFDILIQLDVYYLQSIKDLQTKSENKKCWSENKKSR